MNYQMLGGPQDGEWIALPPEATGLRVAKFTNDGELVVLQDPDEAVESLTFSVPIRGQFLDWYAGVPS